MSGASVEARALREDELPEAQALLAPEGWAFEEDELARLARLGGAFGAFDGDALLGFLTVVNHPPVRWVGNVVVSPEARGKGVAARMLARAMEGAETVGLYSVEKAVTLYERLGFKAHGHALAMRAADAEPRTPGLAGPLRAADLRDVVRLDRQATGMDRRALLHELLRAYPDHWRIVRQHGDVTGFGLAKPYQGATEIGPVVATTSTARDALLDQLLADAPGPHEAAVLAESRDAVDALTERGFTQAFRAVTMFRGEPPRWRPEQMAAAAGLEKG